MEIIIKGRPSIGKTRSEQEQNLRKEWGKTVTDEQLDKIKFLEKKADKDLGSKQNFFDPMIADEVK
jgi:hypothetical protein